jgi:hypothetical protein
MTTLPAGAAIESDPVVNGANSISGWGSIGSAERFEWPLRSAYHLNGPVIANKNCRIGRRIACGRNIDGCIEDVRCVLQKTFHISLFGEGRAILSLLVVANESADAQFR